MIIDIVPNHLGIEHPIENPAWWDVLRLGQDSPYASWFDIDWSRGRIVVPVLGDDPQLSVVDGELRYFEHRFPLAPGSWSEGEDAAAVHDRQHYELIHHSRGNSELNYRRFFAITTLAGVRAEDPEVFAATHALIRSWCEAASPGCVSITPTACGTRSTIWIDFDPLPHSNGSLWRRSWSRVRSCQLVGP